MLYLFTSNARGRYIEDIPNILALPEGAIYNFRYDDPWVEDGLKRDLAQQTFHNVDALIILVVQPKKKPIPENEIQYYPLRRAVIRDLKLYGKVLSVEFQLGQYVNWQRLNNFSDEQRRKIITDLVPTNLRPPIKYISNNPAPPSSVLPFADITQSVEAWQFAVTAVGTIDEWKNTVFYRVEDIRMVQEPILSKFRLSIGLHKQPEYVYKNVPLEEILPGSSGYTLQSSTTYVLRLNFFQPRDPQEPVKGSIVSPVVDQSYIGCVPKPIQINFRYENSSIPFMVTALNQDVITRLDIGLQGGNSPTASSTQSTSNPVAPPLIAPQTTLFLKLTYPRLQLYLGFFSLFVAQLLIASTGKAKALLTFLNMSKSIINQAGAIDAILAILGSGITAITLFILYKRLPGASK